MLNPDDILQTISYIAEDKLDIRTVTMGISLLDCADHDGERARERAYAKITHLARNLVNVAEDIEGELGIPIINKRISVTPISLVAAANDDADPIAWAQMLDQAAHETGVDFIGGFSALVEAGATPAESALIEAIPEALAQTSVVCSSVNVASTQAGINMDAVAHMGRIVARCGIDATKLVVFANSVPDNPFMAGAYHGVSLPDCVVSVGVSGPGVVTRAIRTAGDCSFQDLANAVKRSAFQVTRMGELVGRRAAERLGQRFGVVDLSLAPTNAVGDSVARALEAMGLERVGAHGTTAALALLNDAVKKGGLMACSHVGGLSGSFIPISEDEGMIEAVSMGALNLSKLEAMTAICSVGLDMVALPGDTPWHAIAGLIADEAAIGVMNSKTTAVRAIPVPGGREGEIVQFGGLLGQAPVMPISPYSSQQFASRGGLIPAPLHRFKN